MIASKQKFSYLNSGLVIEFSGTEIQIGEFQFTRTEISINDVNVGSVWHETEGDPVFSLGRPSHYLTEPEIESIFGAHKRFISDIGA